TPLPPPPTATPRQQLPREDFGSWRYYASWQSVPGSGCLSADDCTEIFVSIRYDADSVAKLRAYAEANRKLADQIAAEGGKADVDITFRNYLAPDAFRKWATAMSLSV